ncbi:hypothetical protein ES5_17843 [Dietzia cinnamea P4]|nr:hypothetical protein ES5_17843 [Dietzia cinnamea P4]OAH62887.1 hypothetical protein AYJ66_12030 [Dietzia cinnamea]
MFRFTNPLLGASRHCRSESLRATSEQFIEEPEGVFCCGRAEFMGSELREHCGQLMCTERLEEPVGVVRVFVVQSVRGISTLGDLM